MSLILVTLDHIPEAHLIVRMDFVGSPLAVLLLVDIHGRLKHILIVFVLETLVCTGVWHPYYCGFLGEIVVLLFLFETLKVKAVSQLVPCAIGWLCRVTYKYLIVAILEIVLELLENLRLELCQHQVFLLLVWIGHRGPFCSNGLWLLVGIIHTENAECLVALSAKRKYIGEVLVGCWAVVFTHSFSDHLIGLVCVSLSV